MRRGTETHMTSMWSGREGEEAAAAGVVVKDETHSNSDPTSSLAHIDTICVDSGEETEGTQWKMDESGGVGSACNSTCTGCVLTLEEFRCADQTT